MAALAVGLMLALLPPAVASARERQEPSPVPERTAEEPGALAEAPAGEKRLLKVRLLGRNGDEGTFRAQVASRQQSFRAARPGMLRGFVDGDLLLITVEARDGEERVTQIRSAALRGLVTLVDRRRGRVWIEVEGREEIYGVEPKRLLDDVGVGDRVRFEFEDRPGGWRVITGLR